MNKKIIPFLLSSIIGVGLFSCSTDSYSSYSYDDPTIYSPTNKVQFSEAVLFISPYIESGGVKKYIVADSLQNIAVRMHNRNWPSKSFSIDTLHLNNKETIGIYRTTTDKITYPIVINMRIVPDKLNTAGDYSDMLNNYLTLPAGVYVCQIQSFDILTISKTTTKLYTPTLNMALEVQENQSSSNLGSFDIRVN